MSLPRARRGPRRWLPQTIRVRLTLLFAALFLAAGAALLAVTYALVAGLPVKAPRPTPAQAKLAYACKVGKAGTVPFSAAGRRSPPWAARRLPRNCGTRRCSACWSTPWLPWAR